MGLLIIILLAWFFLSIPVALVVGAVLRAAQPVEPPPVALTLEDLELLFEAPSIR